MFGRPRCREWTPLATQQLRLRSLIQIVGYNIRPPEWCKSQCSFYLTLHHTTMSAPFYTSEKISSPHPKWKEIDSEITQRMSSTNVVIRIWCHVLHPSDEGTTPQNTVIQTWGVYFSGLRYIGANLASNFTSDCFKSNTLVFQMHGGYFCSYKSLKLDIIPPENELEHGSLSSDSSGRTNLSKITLESKLITSNRLKESRSISPSKYNRRGDKEYSKSHSPSERGFQNFALRYSASMNIDHDRRRDDSSERVKENQNHIYEYSPDHMDVMEFTSTEANCDSLYKNASQEELSASKIDLSETAESYDLRSEAGVPKYRYMALNFLKSEIRPSYNASKLQTLHLLQYAIKKKQEAVQEIKEKIYKNSSVTNDSWSQPDEFEARLKLRKSDRNLFDDDEKSKTKEQTDSSKNGRIDRPVSNGPRLTLKLNDLLAYKSKPSPFQRAEHVRLTKQLEILRFKRIILSDERDSKLANIRRLKERRAKLYEENQDIGSELMQNYHTLSKRADAVKESRQTCAAMRDLAARAHAALANQRCELLHQLHQIFYMDQHDQSTWSICGVPFAVCGDENPRNTNPVSDSVAAGFVAQATCLAASILNQPLRYKITLLGSASKILDITPDLPDPNIPLFARGGDRTLFRYAMFLLNKCIAQLLWGRGLPITDIRPTLANLQRLLITPSNLSDTTKLFGTHRWVVDSQYPRTQSLRSLVAGDRGKYRQFNRFKDAVDGQPPDIAMTLRMHRQSRSVGSYHDDQELPALNASTTSIMGSESNIYNMKLMQNTSQELKSHSSDSAINSFADDKYSEIPQKVEFTLGDGEKLVKLSSNNEDVKRICSEIEDYCSINQGLDVVNHIGGIKEYMRRVSGIDVCEVCESNNIEEHMKRASEIDICERYESNGDKDIKEHMRRASQIDICERCESNKDGECDMECANRVTDVTILPSAEAILDIGQVFENNESNG